MQLSGSDDKVNIYKGTSISGNLNAAVRILIDGSHLNVQPKSSTSSETLVFDQSFSTQLGSDSHGINVYGRQGGNSHEILQRLKWFGMQCINLWNFRCWARPGTDINKHIC